MVSVGKHVDWLDAMDAVLLREEGKVAGLSGGISADVYNLAGTHGEQLFDHLLVHAGAGRVGDHYVGSSVGRHKVGSQHLCHVARMEFGIVDVVEKGILASGDDGVLYVFNAYHVSAEVGQEQGNGAGAGVEVIDKVVGCQLGKLCNKAIESLCLSGISLVKGLGADGEMEWSRAIVAFHHLGDVVAASEGGGGEVGVGIVHFVVEDVLQRCDLGELLVEVLHQTFPTRVPFGNDDHYHPFACARVADDEVAEVVGVVGDVVVGRLVG